MTASRSAPPAGDAERRAFTPAFSARVARRRVAAWALWDWGSAAFNAVATTFVFGRYLADAVAVNGAPENSIRGATWIAITSACAGLVIAVTAPVMGQRADAGGHRKRNLGIWTALVIACMYLMVLVQDDYSFLWLGLMLLGVGSICSEIAGVSYNAMLNQVSTPTTAGRISGIGWASGYVGGIILLLVCFVGLISPKVGWFGVTGADGLNVRVTMVFAATWFLVFAIPLFVAVPEVARAEVSTGAGFVASYRKLFADIRELWRVDRNAVKFLIASALYRDGLAAVFSFGAILAATVWGLSADQVIIFGIGANVIAALGAFLGGVFDDILGPKRIVLISLIGLIAAATVLFFVHSTTLFWVFALALCLFVGPAQSSSRVFMARLAPAGHEGQMFGLYATTGRAVSFLAPALFALFTGVTHHDRPGIIAIALVLAVGLAALLVVRPPARGRAVTDVEQVTSTG